MHQLIIKTAIPFGYLIFFLLWLILFIISVRWLIISSIAKTKIYAHIFSSAIIVAFLILVVYSNLYGDDVNWNPVIYNNKVLIGQWTKENSILNLYADGNYSCVGKLCGQLGITGKWKHYQDFEVEFVSNIGNQTVWRVTINNHKYQFVAGAIGDPDTDETYVTFTK